MKKAMRKAAGKIQAFSYNYFAINLRDFLLPHTFKSIYQSIG